MDLDPVLLSRLQFAWVVGWHILLPAFTVGLASFIAMLEGVHAATQNPIFLRLSQFWLRVFAISFGMGVVTGIVMPFQFGTNWSRYSDAAGNVISPLLAYEGLTAFFLESAFLGVLLFGRKLVPPAMHFVAALLVAAGTLFSSFWILATNSWMQTPAGHQVIDGRFLPESWMEIIFSPSFVYRLAHTVSAFYVTTAFVVLGVAAYTLRRGLFVAEGRVMLRLALWFLAIFVPLQMVLGDMHGLNTLKYQPAKLAAMEGLWDTGRGVPASIIGWPDMRAERNDAEIAIPKLGSLYLTHSWDGEVKGLKDFPPDERPPVPIVYFAFRIMVGIAVVMFATVGMRTAAVVAAARGHDRLVSETLSARFSARVHCRHRRMDDDRSRPPAVDDLRPAADGRFGLPFPHRVRCAAVPPALRGSLPDHVSGWARSHAPDRSRGTGAADS